MIWRCDLVPQYNKYRDRVLALTDKICLSGRYILANEVTRFEESFADYLGVKRVVAVANGTDALTLILMAMGIGSGDEVITTPYTAIPTVSAIIDSGAKPVFVDIDPDSYLMDIDKVKNAISSRTKAIMPVHIFGNMVDVEQLQALVGNIPVIEDACQAHGSSIRGKKAGSIGYASAFSFYPTKNLGGYGDGGAIATNDEGFADRLKKMRMYGMTDKDHIEFSGINTRLDELQAAFLSIKLPDLDEMNQARRNIAERYQKEITNKYVKMQRTPEGVLPNYHICALRYSGDRDKFIKQLEEKEIQTNIYYPVPLHLQKANRFLGYKAGDFPSVEEVCTQAVAITMYPELDKETLDFVIREINNAEV